MGECGRGSHRRRHDLNVSSHHFICWAYHCEDAQVVAGSASPLRPSYMQQLRQLWLTKAHVLRILALVYISDV